MESTVHSGLLGNVTRGRAADAWDELDKEVKLYETPAPVPSIPIQNVQQPRIETQTLPSTLPFRLALMPSPARPLPSPARTVSYPKPTGFDPSAPETETWNRTGFTEASEPASRSKNMVLWGGLAVSALIVAGYFFLRK